MGREQIIENYVQRLLQWEEPVTKETLKTLAADAGLGPDDIAAVQEHAQNHLERGKNYLYFDCLDDAIEELTQTVTLDPLNFEGFQNLAHAYDQRYAKQKNETDKQQAMAMAKRCLEINPKDANSVVLISSLEQGVNTRQNYLWLGVGLVVLAIGIKPAIDFVTQRSTVQQLTEEALINEAAAEAAKPEEAPSSDQPAAADIPVTLSHGGLELDPRQSRLDNYEDSSYYTLQGVLLNTGDQEIEAITLNVDYLDAEGTIIETTETDAIAETDAIVRPGDSHAFEIIHKTTPDLANVELNVLTIDEVPAAKRYEKGNLVPVDWAFQKPTQLNFDLRIRNENVNRYDISDDTYFSAAWDITNTGDTAIRRLKLQVDFYNSSGDVIFTEDLLAVYGGDAPMLAAEIRPLRVITSVDKDYARYQVKVVEAE